MLKPAEEYALRKTRRTRQDLTAFKSLIASPVTFSTSLTLPGAGDIYIKTPHNFSGTFGVLKCRGKTSSVVNANSANYVHVGWFEKNSVFTPDTSNPLSYDICVQDDSGRMQKIATRSSPQALAPFLTRASQAWALAPNLAHNLLPSSDVGNATYFARGNGSTPTASKLGSRGTLRKLESDGSNSLHALTSVAGAGFSVLPGVAIEISVEAALSEEVTLVIACDFAGVAFYNLQTGVVTDGGWNGGSTLSMAPTLYGTYICRARFTPPANTSNVFRLGTRVNGATVIPAGNGIYVGQPQVQLAAYIGGGFTPTTGTAVPAVTFKSYAVNEARVLTSPVGVDAILREPSSTNAVANASFAGNVATHWQIAGSGVNGIVGVLGTPAFDAVLGMSYVDLTINGTATGAGSLYAQVFTAPANSAITAVQNDVVTASAVVSLISGSLGAMTAQVEVVEADAAGALIVSSGTQIPLVSVFGTQRIKHTRTIAGVAAASAHIRPVRIDFVPGNVATNAVFRIALPQIEKLPHATQPIPTSAGAVTRARDELSVPLSQAVGAGSPFSLAVDFCIESPGTSGTNRVVGGSSLGVAITPGGGQAQVYNGTTLALPTGTAFYTFGARGKVGYAADGSGRSLNLNGCVPTSDVATHTAQGSSILIGELATGSDIQSPAIFIHSFQYENVKWSAATLQAKTT